MSWSRFCRIPLGGSVPHHSTLKKIAKRCGPAAIEALNEALLAKAAENKVLKTDRVRADTTVVPGDVGYPTDSGLLARGVIRLVASGRASCTGSGWRPAPRCRDRGRSMRRRAHDIGAWLRRRTDTAKEEVLAITAEMARSPRCRSVEARRVADNARRGLRRAGADGVGQGRRRRWPSWTTLIERLDRVVAQTRLRVAGQTPESATRLVSLHDPDARPIRKAGSATGRVRLPGPGARQRGRDRGGSQPPCRQPARRPAAGPSRRTDQETGRAGRPRR